MYLFMVIVFSIWCSIGLILIMIEQNINQICNFDKFTLPQKICTIFMFGPIVWCIGLLIYMGILLRILYMKFFNYLGKFDIKITK